MGGYFNPEWVATLLRNPPSNGAIGKINRNRPNGGYVSGPLDYTADDKFPGDSKVKLHDLGRDVKFKRKRQFLMRRNVHVSSKHKAGGHC